MSGATTTTTTTTTLRFFNLLSSSPLPLLHRPYSFHLLRRLSHHRTSLFLPPSPFNSPPKWSHQVHTQPHQPLWDATPSSFSNSTPYSNHPWPEFLHFVNWVSVSRYGNDNGDAHNIKDAHQMSPSFLRVANACLSFSRYRPDLLWYLPREDIEVIIEDNDSPFLFENASSTIKRMNWFRRGATNDVSESDKPSTIDLMELLLSYAHLAIGNSENMHNRVETSVRKLFHELVKAKENYVESVATTNEYSETYGQVPRSLGIRVDMKKGDWICPRCNFMNFAKNSQCLECKETRPKKFITGGEWECPQCDFYNFSRNVVCLRCDCKKPGSNPFINPTSSSNLIPDSFTLKNSTGKIIAGSEIEQTWFTKIRQLEEESGEQNRDFNSELETNVSSEMGSKDYEREESEKSERWFKKVEELHDVNDLPSAIADEDFPKIMPMRKGENRFVVGKKKDRSLTTPMYKRKAAMEQAGNAKFVPFVPFPPDYFAKDKKQEATESTNSSQQTSSDFQQGGTENENKASRTVFEASNDANKTQKSLNPNLSSERKSENERSVETWRMKSLEGSGVKEPDPLDMSEEAKAERWFRRVAQIKDISELSEIPDEDFPSIMPMRKGVNRFVVSKRKTPLERRLTSSQYRRNLPTQNSDPMMGKEKDSN